MIRYRPMKRARIFSDLSDTVDMLETEQMTQALENRMRRQDRQITWINRTALSPMDVSNKMAEIIVNPQGDVSTLIRFMGLIDETLLHAETYGSILRTAYSSDGCVSLTVIIEPDKLNKLVTILAVMPEVETVEERSPETLTVHDDTRKFRGIPVSEKTRPRRQIEVKLEEPVLAA